MVKCHYVLNAYMQLPYSGMRFEQEDSPDFHDPLYFLHIFFGGGPHSWPDRQSDLQRPGSVS